MSPGYYVANLVRSEIRNRPEISAKQAAAPMDFSVPHSLYNPSIEFNLPVSVGNRR
jgi:hypothetical protein